VTAPRYVYAVGRALDPAGLGGLAGIDGAEVHQIAHRDVGAVVSAAPPDEAALRARLGRLDELAAVAEAHHAVVAAVATRTVVAPFQLATIYQDEGGVRDLLRDRYDDFRALLDRLSGTVELGVKLYVDETPPAQPPPAPGGSGRDYLKRLSHKHRRRDEQWHEAAAAAERIDTALGASALGRSHHRPQPAQLSGAPGHNILNAAYLVATDRLTEFTALARRLTANEPALRVEVTGPWAPYSFTDPDRP
jgi:hypothetical protein